MGPQLTPQLALWSRWDRRSISSESRVSSRENRPQRSATFPMAFSHRWGKTRIDPDSPIKSSRNRSLLGFVSELEWTQVQSAKKKRTHPKINPLSPKSLFRSQPRKRVVHETPRHALVVNGSLLAISSTDLTLFSKFFSSFPRGTLYAIGLPLHI